MVYLVVNATSYNLTLIDHHRYSVDVRDIIADDEALQAGVLPSLQTYNLEQFITADVPGCEHQVCIPFLTHPTQYE